MLTRDPMVIDQDGVAGQGRQSQRRTRIFFYDKTKPYYGFTNFSGHPVVYRGNMYPTSEHLFQAFKVRSYTSIFMSAV